MTPQENAVELVNKFYSRIGDEQIVDTENWSAAKYCAVMAVTEIIAHIEPSIPMDVIEARIKYWTEVIKEIHNL
jgi:hypothetical protein